MLKCTRVYISNFIKWISFFNFFGYYSNQIVVFIDFFYYRYYGCIFLVLLVYYSVEWGRNNILGPLQLESLDVKGVDILSQCKR